MDFDDNAGLDTSQVNDARGRSFPGGGLAVGGGMSVIGLIVALVLGVSPADLLGGGGAPQGGAVSQSDIAERCRTGADAERYTDCRVVAVVNSVQAYWSRSLGGRYQRAQTQLFTGGTATEGCGSATSAVGPFYCPADDTVYLDLGFFEDLKTKLGANGGAFAQAYVVAHEYGHHVQDVLGTSERAGRDRRTGPLSASVRIELQADCYAGAWAANATSTGYVANLTPADIADGLDAAASVGDDRIQSAATGRVDRESWTHGSASQRQRWFTVGYRAGTPEACDTFATNEL